MISSELDAESLAKCMKNILKDFPGHSFALNAVFASAELAVLSVNESKINRLAERGSKKARRLRKLLKEPAKFLSTIQIAITLSGFLGSAFAADGFSDPLVDWLVG